MIELTPGDQIRLRDDAWQVEQCDGCTVSLTGLGDGQHLTVDTSEILADNTFVAPGRVASVDDQRLLDQMPDHRRRDAEFWYLHMHIVKYGATPAERALLGDRPPVGTVEQRLTAKRDELAVNGIAVSMATMWRRYSGFCTAGIVGCADRRGLPGHTRSPGIDPIVYGVLDEVMQSFLLKSTPSKSQVIELAIRELVSRDIAIPCRSTMYQLVTVLDRGRHTFGEAPTRRSLANSPDRSFGKVRHTYPGQEIQLDATPLDAFVLTADGRTERVDLALAIDVATRTIAAAILRPRAATSVDAVELWTGAMRPMQLRPGWSEAMSMARSYLPADMLPEDVLAQHIAARPILDVRSVFVDRGKIFVSKHFERALESRGVDLRIASPYDPTNKPIVERIFKSINEDFVRWIAGYKGRAVAYRGAHPERDAVWPLPLLQAMLDEWIVSVYQQRPTAGLVDNLMPRKNLSPNAMYAALTEHIPGGVRVLSEDEWISLQPVEWRSIQRYGINFQRLIYDSPETRFHDLRRRRSKNKTRGSRWEVRYDPGNLLCIWVRDDDEGGWIRCDWVLAQHCPHPFGLDTLRSLLKYVDRQHEIDQQVLQKLHDLHIRLQAGPDGQTPTVEPAPEVTRAIERDNTRLAVRDQPAETATVDSLEPEPDPRSMDERLAAVAHIQPLTALRAEEW
jgi:transposase InsO family protein